MNNYMEDLKEREERNGRLVNLIMDYAIENKMSAKDVDKCVEKAKEVFYSDARIIRTAQEVPVQEQLNVDKANKILENQIISLSKVQKIS